MTYKTRQEVLRAAADWMDVCKAAGVEAMLKWNGAVKQIRVCTLNEPPHEYEFPLALLEGKEVWVGSELYSKFFNKTFIVTASEIDASGEVIFRSAPFGKTYLYSCSWNQPKPATVMVELPVKVAEIIVSGEECPIYEWKAAQNACKNALENLK